MHQTRFTISMEILGLLFESNFDPVRGWAFKQRPGAEYFMSKVGFPNSELVFFTEASGQDILPIIDRLPETVHQFLTISDSQRNSSDISKLSSHRWRSGSFTEIRADMTMEITRKILTFSAAIQKRYKLRKIFFYLSFFRLFISMFLMLRPWKSIKTMSSWFLPRNSRNQKMVMT